MKVSTLFFIVGMFHMVMLFINLSFLTSGDTWAIWTMIIYITCMCYCFMESGRSMVEETAKEPTKETTKQVWIRNMERQFNEE